MVIFAEISEGSSSSSSARYDVFLSFSWVDTRHGFTDHLRKALVDANISTFLDGEEIESGEDLKPELKVAIKASRASVVVLSQNYANSSCCLDELVLILEQHRASNQIVIPVFYHVEPTHVKRQGSSFGDAMTEHKKKMEAETDANKRSVMAQKIDRWEKALTEVGDIKGKDINGRRETIFIEEIVKDICHQLRISSMSPSQQLFGMDYTIKFVTSWLKDTYSDTGDILTILGIGGIGKTSLAKYIYELHSHEFDSSSFVSDISRRCDENFNSRFNQDMSLKGQSFNGLFYVQKQLHDDISGPRSVQVQVHDASMYSSKIENVVAHKKVFLVLDDVDSLDQLDALLGSKGFRPGSKVIITTRYAWLTKSCALFKTNVETKNTKIVLKGLSKTESQRLLCFHAFMSNDPRAGYEEVSRKLVMYCEGHPLALEVLGKSLHNQVVAYWEECVEGLKKEYGSPINNVLKKSFDSLPSIYDKHLFKDIACFFVGMDRYVIETILNACGINASSGITNLIDRCLLSIGKYKELTMHRLVREMGRFEVHNESPDKPWKRSRLWCHDESFKVLKQKKGTRYIQGLTLDTRGLEKEKLHGLLELGTEALSEMDELMLLQLNSVQMQGSYENFPKKLRWLCMRESPLKSIPSDLPMEYLVALDMSYSKIESFGNSDPQEPEKRKRQKLIEPCSKRKGGSLGSLKILNLSFCRELVCLSGFDQVPALERLIVTHCTLLSEVCESIEECAELVLIDLSYCKKLKKPPRTIYMLKKVITLLLPSVNLDESQSENLDMDFPETFKVVSIGVNTKSSSSDIPNAVISSHRKFFKISLPRSLVSLSLKNNNLSTQSYTMDFSSLPKLKLLSLDGYDLNEYRIEISDVDGPEMFKDNDIGTNTKSSSSSNLPSDSKSFRVSLPKSLVSLSLNNDNLSTESFPIDFSCLAGLEELYLDKNPIISLPDCVRSLPNLKILSLKDCFLLTSVEHPPHSLRELILPHSRLLRKVVFDPQNLSKLKLSVELTLFPPFIFEIEGTVKIQPMTDVEDEVLHSLGWTNILSEGPKIQMYYEFGIFSTVFVVREMPNWISYRSKEPSISFIVPSNPNNLKGLNLFSMHEFLSLEFFLEFPVIKISNITKNQTWIYKHCLKRVDFIDDCLVFLSHWMFGKNEMEGGDQVTITVTTNFGLTKECGVSFVYDDGKTDEEDALGYYKSWNHIIGGDLSPFQTSTGEYLLETEVMPYYREFDTW